MSLMMKLVLSLSVCGKKKEKSEVFKKKKKKKTHLVVLFHAISGPPAFIPPIPDAFRERRNV